MTKRVSVDTSEDGRLRTGPAGGWSLAIFVVVGIILFGVIIGLIL